MEPIVLGFGQNVPDPVLLDLYSKDWEEYLRFDGLVVPITEDRMAGMYGDHTGGGSEKRGWSPLWLAFSGEGFPKSFNDSSLSHFQHSIAAMTRFNNRSDNVKQFKHNFLPLWASGGAAHRGGLGSSRK